MADLIERYWEYAKQYYGGGNESKLYRIKAALRPLNRLYGFTACQFGPLALAEKRFTSLTFSDAFDDIDFGHPGNGHNWVVVNNHVLCE